MHTANAHVAITETRRPLASAIPTSPSAPTTWGVPQDLGGLEEARASFKRTLRIFEKFLPPGHPNIQAMRRNLERLGEGD